MIVIGASLGGMKAMMAILEGLPASFPLPIAAALHRHKDSDDSLKEILQLHSRMPVLDPSDKEPIRPGHVYLAPADYHLFVEGDHFSLSTDDLVQYARPSIDVLFESAADTYHDQAICVVLTGGNQDGAKGAAKIKAQGGLLIVQEPATAECAIMPEATLAGTQADHVLPISEIGPFLLSLLDTKSPA